MIKIDTFGCKWIHGDLTINGKRLQAGDGLAISEENKLQILAEKIRKF